MFSGRSHLLNQQIKNVHSRDFWICFSTYFSDFTAGKLYFFQPWAAKTSYQMKSASYPEAVCKYKKSHFRWYLPSWSFDLLLFFHFMWDDTESMWKFSLVHMLTFSLMHMLTLFLMHTWDIYKAWKVIAYDSQCLTCSLYSLHIW